MKRRPRRNRAHLWAGIYVALFGPGDVDTDESGPATTATGTEEQTDDHPRGTE